MMTCFCNCASKVLLRSVCSGNRWSFCVRVVCSSSSVTSLSVPLIRSSSLSPSSFFSPDTSTGGLTKTETHLSSQNRRRGSANERHLRPEDKSNARQMTINARYQMDVCVCICVFLCFFLRDSLSVLREFSGFVRSVEANQSQQLERIQTFVSDEVLRQNRLANDTKNTCEEKLSHLQVVLEQVILNRRLIPF